jgi:hypothetical protein
VIPTGRFATFVFLAITLLSWSPLARALDVKDVPNPRTGHGIGRRPLRCVRQPDRHHDLRTSEEGVAQSLNFAIPTDRFQSP